MKTRKRREDSFFGMHFDFHAGRNQVNIGANPDPETLHALMEQVKPDYVQCDTKGHSGNSSYPTKAGNPAPEMKGDILRLWREVTAQHGVALYAHHSGVWDNRALENHPDWAACHEDGTPDKNDTSVFGPYADEQLIPQLKEMALEYGLDGAWIDGECWAFTVDYSHWAMEAWKKEKGKDSVSPEDKDAFIDFNREGFRKYVTHYIDEVHKAAPAFQVASNWMYTSYMPERRAVPVDFISGDYAPVDSLSSCRVEGRCTMGQDRPWDLMAWGFAHDPQTLMHYTKELPQLCQEAAVVIALGGGFQVYNPQLVETVSADYIPMWAKLAEFCRARQALCHKAKPVPQAAVIFSEKGYYDDRTRALPFQGDTWKDMASGLEYLLDNGYSTEVLKTHQLTDPAAYGLLWVPNWPSMEDELKAKLLKYAENGGALVLAGPRAAALFAADLGLSLGETAKDDKLFIVMDGRQAALSADVCHVSAAQGSVLFRRACKDSSRWVEGPVAVTVPYGKGTVAVSGAALGSSYKTQKSAGVRRYVKALAEAAGFVPMFTVEGSHFVEAMLMEKDGKLRLNLTNMGGGNDNERYRGIDEITPLGPLTVTLRLDKAPRSVLLRPEEEIPEMDYKDGLLTVTVPRLEIHTVVEISL